MSAFKKTQYRIRMQLVDENNKVLESFISPERDWLDLKTQFDKFNKSRWKN